MKNQVQLITYIDRLAGADAKALSAMLAGPLSGLFGGVHLLPFFYPINGSDAGFDPIDHTRVDPLLGSWQDISQLGEQQPLMADLIVNHMSADSPEFQDVLAKGEASPYWDLFLTRDKVFTDADDPSIQRIYRPRDTSCFTHYTLADGREIPFWTTFTSKQIDIDVNSEAGQAYLSRILDTFADNGITMIRLDAAGYAIKKAGSRCFMLDETYEFINQLAGQARQRGIDTLVEIHSHHQTQVDIAKRVDRVYDFALPPLVLHALFSADVVPLLRWLDMAPRNCVTVLDTHDGIGIIDVGPMEGKPGLLNDAQIDQLVEQIHHNSGGQSRQATGAAASNVDLYQVNCTYYDALGGDDGAYLIARAIQFFCPGVPQVYYGGLLTERNDMALLAKTQVGRDINRPYLTEDKVDAALERPVVAQLCELIRLRNTHPAFNGHFSMQGEGGKLVLTWEKDEQQIQLSVELPSRRAIIRASGQPDWLIA
ncbi:sucrose phosphorylase [Gallaecimonas sp. GXIMD1310]|uniref:sucrose phosphorylase n=1 Tax=Gallaecimonas sp. GXIMD1310 TaxID=3131926 RepID=UPI003249E07F